MYIYIYPKPKSYALWQCSTEYTVCWYIYTFEQQQLIESFHFNGGYSRCWLFSLSLAKDRSLLLIFMSAAHRTENRICYSFDFTKMRFIMFSMASTHRLCRQQQHQQHRWRHFFFFFASVVIDIYFYVRWPVLVKESEGEREMEREVECGATMRI